MKAFRVGGFTLASLIFSFALSTPALADVRSIDAAYTLMRPGGTAFTYWGQDVAIDGGHIIVLAGYEGGQQALHYRRMQQWPLALSPRAGHMDRRLCAHRRGDEERYRGRAVRRPDLLV